MDFTIFTPAVTQNLREVVYDQIKEAIVNGLIPAGSKLSELELSRQFSVSRTPVREAIRQLAETGLVSLSSRRGAYVILPTAKDAADLYEIRYALEAISVEHLCASQPEDFLRRARVTFEEVSNDWDANRFMELDTEFHADLWRFAGNNYLGFMLGKVGDIIQICRHYAIGSIQKSDSSREHIAIIDAMLSGDAGAARLKLREHIDSTRDGLIKYISAHPEATGPAD
ncbi:MAG: GntR family transcriptional regulator [Synergistaceae bacterium]|jgi:DNA-binding GntR family transcriptional regulator|nr:GntR family transcriptional regulator [Synergistaceae bacterium]